MSNIGDEVGACLHLATYYKSLAFEQDSFVSRRFYLNMAIQAVQLAKEYKHAIQLERREDILSQFKDALTPPPIMVHTVFKNYNPN